MTRPVDLPHSPAADRNKGPILEQLGRWLPPTARVLEIASGTGQHAEHAATCQPGWVWQPTDRDPQRAGAVSARCVGLPSVRPAGVLDVTMARWPHGPDAGEAPYDLVFAANLLHVAPWGVCGALMRGAARVLAPSGLLVVYGPFLREGVPTAPSNAAFDADLRARDADWGLRALEAVDREAEAAGLARDALVEMPAHNLLLRWRRRRAST